MKFIYSCHVANSGSSLACKIGGIVFFAFCFTLAGAQTISQGEYFFDSDPGPGNGIPLTIGIPSDPVTFTQSISTTGLTPGYHILFARTRSSDGRWSLYEPREFIVIEAITAAEYFFDQDPGIGNGIPLSIGPDQLTVSTTIPTASLPDGDHVLFVRTRHQNNKWSHSEAYAFYIQARIVQAEYFIDTDPGFGNGTPLSIGAPSELLNLNTSVALGALANGDHYLFVRTMDMPGKWSFYEPQLFTIDDTLPIELLDFTARKTDDTSVKLTWTTLTEVNTDFFSVQHSVDGYEFAEIARVKGAGNSTTKQYYTDFDKNPVRGTNYYRLKPVDLNRRSTFSRIVTIEMVQEPGLSIYPNPASTEWFIDFSNAEKADSRLIELLDVQGRKCVEVKTLDEKVVQFSRQELASGIYVLRISSSKGSVIVRKMIFN
jgi:hypothetical protein